MQRSCNLLQRPLIRGAAIHCRSPILPRARFLHQTTAAFAKPRRTILYIPGSDERKVRKALQLTKDQVDCVVFDLEDSVTYSQKTMSTDGGYERCVRINSSDIGKKDLEVILQSPNLQSILIPKVNNAKDVETFDAIIKTQEKTNPSLRSLKILASIESAEGVVSAEKIATSSKRLDTLVFAAEDYCADVGLIRTKGRLEMLYARQKIVTVAKAFGLQAIDLVCVDFKNADVLAEECQEGRTFGFTGKQAIHPAQCSTIQAAFSPSDDLVKYAQRIVDGYKAHEKEGVGAFNLDGKMIDMPVVKWAMKILST
ncbi:hypothetical protein HDU67_007772 [Dinochytrium kinnereticum]|nr:hypothetical protein HDU67_007772 [Dinochytrium kinnereticum]